MTSGEGGFQIGDDAVVAKIAIEVPGGSAESLHQINVQAEQLKVNLEAVSRSQADYLEYLRQIPQMTEQAAQAQRSLITQLERTAYIQQELGGLANVGVGGAPQGGGQYSTAAPAGYADPFAGMTAGMRGATMLGGGPQNVNQATGYMQNMMMNDPRMFANMLAQRGMNPATLGMTGQAVLPSGTGGMGQGASPAASTSSQATQAARDSAAPPDASQGGQTTKAEPQRIPETPSPDAPMWQQAVQQVQAMGKSVINESRGGGGRGSLLGMAGAGMQAAGGYLASRGGGGGGGTGGGGGGGGGEGGGEIPKWAKGIGVAGGLTTAALGINKLVQNAGEQIQQYANLGGERGGGAVEGAQTELSSRVMALNPFITLEQSRQIMQAGLRSGYQGKEFETLTDMMAENLKNMNMSANDSMQLFNDTVVQGGQSVENFKDNMKNLHDLAATGFVGQTEKIEQVKATAATTGALGFEGGSQQQIINAVTEGFAGNPILAPVMPGALNAAMGNEMFLTAWGREAGVTGLPGEIAGKMSDLGPDAAAKALDSLLLKTAQRFTVRGNERHSAEMFRLYMGQLGLDLTPRQGLELYRYLINGGKASEYGNKRVQDARGRETAGERVLDVGKGIGDVFTGHWGSAWENFKNAFTGGGDGERDSEQTGDGENFTGNLAPKVTAESPYAARGRPPANPPANAGQASHSGVVSTQGTVSGEVRIVVDQQGRVTAPSTVKLSGNQTAVNHGQGGTLNNPSPGDQNYLHSNTGMS